MTLSFFHTMKSSIWYTTRTITVAPQHFLEGLTPDPAPDYIMWICKEPFIRPSDPPTKEHFRTAWVSCGNDELYNTRLKNHCVTNSRVLQLWPSLGCAEWTRNLYGSADSQNFSRINIIFNQSAWNTLLMQNKAYIVLRSPN